MFPEPEDAISYGNKLKFTKTKIQLLNRFIGFIHESREISPNILIPKERYPKRNISKYPSIKTY